MDPTAGRGAVSWPRVIRGLPTYHMCYRHRQGSACVSFWRDRLPYELGADLCQDYLDAAQRISDRDAALVIVLYHYVQFLILFCVIGKYSPPVPQQAGDDQHQERYDPCGTTGEQDRNEVLYLLNLASVSGVLLLFAATHSRSGSANDRSPSEVGFVLRLAILKRSRRGGMNGILPLPDRQKPRAVRCISGMSWAFAPIACTARPGARRVRRLWSNALASGSRSVRPPR